MTVVTQSGKVESCQKFLNTFIFEEKVKTWHFHWIQLLIAESIWILNILTIYVTEGFKLWVRGGLLVALSYAIDFHLLDPIQSYSQFKKKVEDARVQAFILMFWTWLNNGETGDRYIYTDCYFSIPTFCMTKGK